MGGGMEVHVTCCGGGGGGGLLGPGLAKTRVETKMTLRKRMKMDPTPFEPIFF